MTAVSQPETAGAADWLSVLPQSWPPAGPVLMVANHHAAPADPAGFLRSVPAGQPF